MRAADPYYANNGLEIHEIEPVKMGGGAVIVKNGEVVEEFDTFVKPGKPITPKITELTGITNEMVDNAPSEAEALKAFLEFADGRILVAHNAHSFDIRFLRAAAKRSGIEFEPTYIDT